MKLKMSNIRASLAAVHHLLRGELGLGAELLLGRPFGAAESEGRLKFSR